MLRRNPWLFCGWTPFLWWWWPNNVVVIKKDGSRTYNYWAAWGDGGCWIIFVVFLCLFAWPYGWVSWLLIFYEIMIYVAVVCIVGFWILGCSQDRYFHKEANKKRDTTKKTDGGSADVGAKKNDDGLQAMPVKTSRKFKSLNMQL